MRLTQSSPRFLRIITVVAALSLAVMVTACDGDDASRPASIALADYLTQGLADQCQHAIMCCTPVELQNEFLFSGMNITDQASCESYLSSLVGGTVSQIQAAITAGRVVYDPQAAADCLAKSKAQTCEEYAANLTLFGGSDMTCDRPPAKGNVAVGETCTFDLECVTGGCSAGHCTALPAVGAACLNGVTCGEGAYCDVSDPGICRALKPDGQACAINSECASNGCNGPMGSTVCGQAALCDNDLTDDAYLSFGSCSEVIPGGPDGDKSLSCNLGTTGGWQCMCATNGVTTMCSTGNDDIMFNACDAPCC